jgi:hypothetical protein
LARAIKKHEKNGRTLKFFIHRSKLQARASDDDGHRESRLIGAVTRPRPTTAFSGQLALRKRRGWSGRRRRHAPASVGLISSEMLACNLDRWIKNFNGRPFFSCFFIARANQKIRILALGRGSILLRKPRACIAADMSQCWRPAAPERHRRRKRRPATSRRPPR